MIAPEWAGMSTARRIAEAIGAPVGWGIVCGLLLAVSAPLYIVGTLFGVLGGVAGGAQHATARAAMARAATGGTLFGLAILLGYEFTGGDGAEVELPHPEILFVAFTLVPAFPLHWLGWRIARSRGEPE